ncbi:NADP-dependent oxidoreductase [Microbispora rosea]|uniref:NADP-dependent oxidoreductase n=1 Tax=Microbispora rosea TaxID=58117 RepID=UPI0037C8EDAA
MKAVGVLDFGGPEELRVVDVPERHAGPGEVRVRVHAAGVSPGDTLLRAGLISLPGVRPPYIPGQDIAGVVDEIGEGAVTGLRIGDRVMAAVLPTVPSGGGYAERVVLPASWVTWAPAGTTHAEASTLPMNGLTALLALDLLSLSPGRTLAVTGAAGSLGGFLVELAAAAGLRVVGDASAADGELVRALGADVVVARGDDVAPRICAAVPEGVDAVADAALIGAPLVDVVRDGGKVVGFRGVAAFGRPVRGISHHLAFVPDYYGKWNKLDELRHWTEAGAVTLRVAATFPAERAADAHRLLEAGGTRGRIVIEF